MIRALLTLTHVLHVDETTTRIGAGHRWPHVACTSTLTLLGLGEPPASAPTPSVSCHSSGGSYPGCS
ncbi:hypothetical protein Acor_67440 [Acrocarpospora corrugata]|uniref:Uncharacterized protein n=1 Tax=Acrocarpospora corrugata TaxID=35763 RepID=A0A5M3W792_9ACTN|nr:hypothetical protein [Acrocarpospora corrugata]GES04676.1 hypothetical protein Acor_67440 [Acrocarpospora corrugata]